MFNTRDLNFRHRGTPPWLVIAAVIAAVIVIAAVMVVVNKVPGLEVRGSSLASDT